MNPMLILLMGCWTRVEVTCLEDAPRDVAADEALDFGGTLADLVATVDATTLDTYDLAGATHRIDVSATPSGDASLVDRELHEEIVHRGGQNQAITYLFEGTCADEVTAPLTLTLTDGDGLVAIEATATLVTTEDGTDLVTAIDGTFDPATATFPAGFHADPTDGAVFLDLSSAAAPRLDVWVTAADGAQEAVLSSGWQP